MTANETIRILSLDAGNALVVFRGKTQKIPIEHLRKIAPQFDIVHDLEVVSLPGVGLVVKGSMMAEYTPLTVGSLYKKPDDERP